MSIVSPKKILVLLALAVLALFAYSGIMYAKDSRNRDSSGKLVDFSHAESKHGADAIRARECLEKRGPDVVYAFKYNKNHRAVQFCFDPKTKELFVRVVDVVQKRLMEVTAYRWEQTTIYTIEDVARLVYENMPGGSWITFSKPGFDKLLTAWGVVLLYNGTAPFMGELMDDITVYPPTTFYSPTYGTPEPQ